MRNNQSAPLSSTSTPNDDINEIHTDSATIDTVANIPGKKDIDADDTCKDCPVPSSNSQNDAGYIVAQSTFPEIEERGSIETSDIGKIDTTLQNSNSAQHDQQQHLSRRTFIFLCILIFYAFLITVAGTLMINHIVTKIPDLNDQIDELDLEVNQLK